MYTTNHDPEAFLLSTFAVGIKYVFRWAPLVLCSFVGGGGGGG